MGLRIPKQAIFDIIYKLDSKYNIKVLCRIAWVSLSWYYKHKTKILGIQTKSDKEKEDVETIKWLCLKHKQKYGYRRITMELKVGWRTMNHKKVLRIMRKYNLLAKLRRKNPYKQIMRATQEHRTAKNKLNREFDWDTPYKKVWTDITYIRFRWEWVYLSVVKDMVTWEILSEILSDNLWLWMVARTMEKLEVKYKKGELKYALFHSDQWFHYTHPMFWKYIKSLWCIQSMSRRWNCIDNAPTESFFGHMKDEIDISECETFEKLEKYIKNYIDHYNNNRPQWNRKKMTPVEYRDHLLSI